MWRTSADLGPSCTCCCIRRGRGGGARGLAAACAGDRPARSGRRIWWRRRATTGRTPAAGAAGAAGGGARPAARRLGRADHAPRVAAAAGGRADLHPRGRAHRRDRPRGAQANAERRLRSEAEMLRLFAGHEAAVHRAGEIAGGLPLRARRAALRVPARDLGRRGPAGAAGAADRRRAWRGAIRTACRRRCAAQAAHELALIGRLNYAPYFLTVSDVVDFARAQGILCQGRGSAANSVVCFALGVTSVSPEIGTMVFERFVSEARDEPPDIDVDFEHERREEVIQYIYSRYGRAPGRDLRHGDPLSRQAGDARGGHGHGAAPRHGGGAVLPDLGLVRAASVPEERMRELGLDPSDRRLALTMRARRRDHRLPAPPQPARRRLRHHRGAARRAGAGRERGDGGPHRHLLGQGRHRRARHPQGRRAGARACSPASARRST